MKQTTKKSYFKKMPGIYLLGILSICFLIGVTDVTASNSQEGGAISGTIVDNNGEALPGVNIVLVGTTVGTVSDIDGNYFLQLPDGFESGSLKISFVGYLSETVDITGLSQLDVSLLPDLQKLDEVIVVGYGVQKKSDLTGAVASVSSEDITESSSVSVDEALQGRAAGVSITQNSGLPGGDVQITIRGISSINGGDPLVIIDGVRGSLSDLSAGEIESVEILKDASSAAIYGSTGGNGVILVTTKRGESGKMRTNFGYYRGWQTLWKEMEMMDKDQFVEIRNIIAAQQAVDRNKEYIPFSDRPDTMQYYNYQDIMFRTALMENYDLSFSGGNEKSTYFLSANYVKQEGILRKSDYDRMSFRINSTHKLSKLITVGENVRFNKSHTTGQQEFEFQGSWLSPMPSILTMYPYIPPYDENGEWSDTPDGSMNPRVEEDVMNENRNNYSIGGMAYVDLNLFKGFTFTSRVSSYTNFNVTDIFTPEYFYAPSIASDVSEIFKNVTHEYGWQIQNYATYNATLGSNHNFSFMAGMESGYKKLVGIEGSRIALFNETEEMWYFNASLDDTTALQVVSNGGVGAGAPWEDSDYAYFGRINYDYNSKYLVTVNLRNDYSSRFGPDYRSGIFPSFSVGWKFSEESFVKDLGMLSFGKLRYGYGRTGANNIDRYAYYSSIIVGPGYSYPLSSSINPNQGSALQKLSNTEIHWEDVVMNNLGLDIGFLNNKLNLTVDLFNKKNIGMLINQDLPAIAGYYQASNHITQLGGDARPVTNIGSVENKGIEITTGFRNRDQKFKYGFDANVTILENEVTDIAGDTILAGSIGVNLTNMCFTAEGYPISQFYGFVTDGLFTWDDAGETPTGRLVIKNQPYTINEANGDTVYAQGRAKPGDFRFKDLNGDGRITNDDKTIIGNPIPKYTVGFSADFEYEGFDLKLFFEGKFGFQIFNGAKLQLMNQDVGRNRHEIVLDQYRDPIVDSDGNILFEGNTDTDLPRLDFKGDNANLARVSNFWVEDGDYVRLRNVQLGYTLPNTLTMKAGIEKLRVYVGAKNLITLTKYTGWDPEISTGEPLYQGLDFTGNYPHSKMVMVGLNLEF